MVLTMPTIDMPEEISADVTFPEAVTPPTPSFALPTLPVMPAITLPAGTSGIPPALPDTAALQASVTSAITAGQSALQSSVTAATGAMTAAAASIKTQGESFAAEMTSEKSVLLQQLKKTVATATDLNDKSILLEKPKEVIPNKISIDIPVIQLKGLIPSKKEQAELKALFASSRTSLAGVQESSMESIKTLQTSVEGTATKVGDMMNSAKTSLGALKTNLDSFASL